MFISIVVWIFCSLHQCNHPDLHYNQKGELVNDECGDINVPRDWVDGNFRTINYCTLLNTVNLEPAF